MQESRKTRSTLLESTMIINNLFRSNHCHMSATLHASFAARCAPQWSRAPQSPTKCRRVPQRLRVSADAGRVRRPYALCDLF